MMTRPAFLLLILLFPSCTFCHYVFPPHQHPTPLPKGEAGDVQPTFYR